MFDFIRKEEYFSWVEEFTAIRDTYASASVHNLKDIQDHYVISRLNQQKNKRILEVGGSDCRVLRNFAASNECWNAEKFDGLGMGPKKVIKTPGVKNAFTYLGEFSPELPDGYFDLVFSISVVEHVETPLLKNFFSDIARVLKPGGTTFHAIDAYLFDRLDVGGPTYTQARLREYLSVPEMTDGALVPCEPAKASTNPFFSCEYATNSDREMMLWNRVVPKLAPMRSVAQSCSLKCEWRKQ